ncbi:MAG: adenylate/guanylate cyclase domain-containing protein [Candidatus Neomarinimicrobiota bacterium]
MLFADVRGSTMLAEKTSPRDFTRLMNRFYSAASKVLLKTDAWIDKLVGDEIIGFYFPGFVGPDHPGVAVQAGIEILRATGHTDKNGPWLPVGIGIHTGTAFVGAVGAQEGVTDVTALGDAVNTGARLGASAKEGEIVLSETTFSAANLQWSRLEQRQLELKGKAKPVSVRVLRIVSTQA